MSYNSEHTGAEVDDAVTKRHTHTNLTSLEGINPEDGKMLKWEDDSGGGSFRNVSEFDPDLTTIGPPLDSTVIANENDTFRDLLGGLWKYIGDSSTDWLQIEPAVTQGEPSTGAVPIGYLIYDSDDSFNLKRHDGGWVWTTLGGGASSLPAGGADGQVLTKQSSSDGDADWETPAAAPTLDSLFNTEALGTTTGAISLDLNDEKYQTVVLTGDPTFSTSNRAPARFLSLKLDANGSDRSLSFSASWKWLGTDHSAGVTLSNGKIAVLSLTCYGTAETDIVATYVAEP